MTRACMPKVRTLLGPPKCSLGVRTLRMGSLENECRAMALHVQVPPFRLRFGATKRGAKERRAAAPHVRFRTPGKSPGNSEASLCSGGFELKAVP